jgi:hypothetical protein
VAGGQKNLSGTNFHASPEGVRRRDAPSNLTGRQFNRINSNLVEVVTLLGGVGMVAGDRIELSTRGFSERQRKLDPRFFINLPGRPLPTLHDNA